MGQDPHKGGEDRDFSTLRPLHPGCAEARFLPAIRPTVFNYPVNIFGKWRGARYSFITRYRSGFAESAGREFDLPFTRLDHLEECLAGTRFDVLWRRHTGRWLRLHASVTLEQALRLIASEELLQP